MRQSATARAAALLALAVWPATAHGHTAHEPTPAAAPSVVASNVEHITQAAGSTGGHVVVEGNRLYMAMYGIGLRMFDISDPTAPTEIGQWRPDMSAIGPRAVADGPPDAAVFDGRHVTVVNGTGRTSASLPTDLRTDNAYFLETTDPSNPQLLWTFEGLHNGESHNGDIVDQRGWWLPSGGGADSEGGETLDNGLRIYDLRPLLQNPPAAPEIIFRGDPVKLWEQSPVRRDRDVGNDFTHTHDITVYPDFEVDGRKRDIALLAEGGSYLASGNTGSMFVIDITDPRNPVVLLRWLHETGEGHHPIRYHHEAQFLDGDPRVVLVTDEDLHNGCNAGGVTALRLSEDLTSAVELSEWFIGYDPPQGAVFGPVCSVHVFSSHGYLAYFGSYNAGLQVVDYSDPAAPERIGFNLQPGADTWGAQYLRDGLVFAGDLGARGLDVFSYVGPVPDLTTAAPEMQPSAAGRLPALTAAVKNIGKLKAPALTLEFRDRDQLLASAPVPPLEPGVGTTVATPFDPLRLCGRRTVTAVVDAVDHLDEASETNNGATETLELGGEPSGDCRAALARRHGEERRRAAAERRRALRALRRALKAGKRAELRRRRR